MPSNNGKLGGGKSEGGYHTVPNEGGFNKSHRMHSALKRALGCKNSGSCSMGLTINTRALGTKISQMFPSRKAKAYAIIAWFVPLPRPSERDLHCSPPNANGRCPPPRRRADGQTGDDQFGSVSVKPWKGREGKEGECWIGVGLLFFSKREKRETALACDAARARTRDSAAGGTVTFLKTHCEFLSAT